MDYRFNKWIDEMSLSERAALEDIVLIGDADFMDGVADIVAHMMPIVLREREVVKLPIARLKKEFKTVFTKETIEIVSLVIHGVFGTQLRVKKKGNFIEVHRIGHDPILYNKTIKFIRRGSVYGN